jgi:hypothetical protein
LDSTTAKLLDKAVAGERLTPVEGVMLLESHDLTCTETTLHHFLKLTYRIAQNESVISSSPEIVIANVCDARAHHDAE